jgi:PAS domain S-box-containing protein
MAGSRAQEPGGPAPPAGSAELAGAILAALPCPVFAGDLSGMCVFQNAASRRGCGPFVGRPLTELPLALDNPARWLEQSRQALAGEIVWGELEAFGAERRFCRYLLAPLRAADQVCGTACLVFDVTDLRHAHQRLAESEARYRLLAENSTDLITRHAPSAQWTYLSPASRSLLGYEPAELVGKDPFEFIHPEDRAGVSVAHAEMLRTGRPLSATFRFRRASGEFVWLESHGKAVFDARTKHLVEFIAICRDVTQRIEADQKLHSRETELAHLDRLSTMGQMASELAHELNQPLYAVANFADACLALVERPAASDRAELQQWLVQIAQQARRAGEVLRRITQFVKKGELNRRRVDLNDCIRDVLALLDIEVRKRGIAVALALDAGLPPIEGDELLLEQVLVNLVRNAVEAMETSPAGGRILTVTSFVRGDKDAGASVSDTGPGLAGDEFEHVFESYFTTKAAGTGMGLAICRSTIEAHGGQIWAENNLRGGATFQFVVPRSAAVAAQPA